MICVNIDVMRAPTIKNIKSAQERQDEIFRRMSADKKIELGAKLWQLAKDLAPDKMVYGANRPKRFAGPRRQDS